MDNKEQAERNLVKTLRSAKKIIKIHGSDNRSAGHRRTFYIELGSICYVDIWESLSNSSENLVIDIYMTGHHLRLTNEEAVSFMELYTGENYG